MVSSPSPLTGSVQASTTTASSTASKSSGGGDAEGGNRLPSPLPSPSKGSSLHVPLSPQIMAAVTGEEDLSSLEELEIIFVTVNELQRLELLTSLRSLTLIDTGLKRIGGLQPVGRTLMRLCLSDQGLKKMEGLGLPNVRELFLHQNSLTKLEGLEGCPKLQRLWLFSNKIPRIQGLHCCGALRELWLQENNIPKVEGLGSLVHLQSLNMAGNPVHDFKCLQKLAALPALQDLSMDDVHFGACPLSQKQEYRRFAICSLKQLRRLDGIEIGDCDRGQAEDEYMQQVLAFNDKVEEVTRTQRKRVEQVEQRRRRTVGHARELKQEMMAAFAQLEVLVKEGREGIKKQHNTQRDVHKQNMQVLESRLQELQRAHTREIDKRVVAEQAKLEEEERVMLLLEQRAVLEQLHGGVIDDLQFTALDGEGQEQQRAFRPAMHAGALADVACQEIGDHTPDFSFLQAYFKKHQATTAGRKVELVVILRAYRIFNRPLAQSFQNCYSQVVAESSKSTAAGGGGDRARPLGSGSISSGGHIDTSSMPALLFVAGSAANVLAWCREGLKGKGKRGASEGGAGEGQGQAESKQKQQEQQQRYRQMQEGLELGGHVVLFSDPKAALLASGGIDLQKLLEEEGQEDGREVGGEGTAVSPAKAKATSGTRPSAQQQQQRAPNLGGMMVAFRTSFGGREDGAIGEGANLRTVAGEGPCDAQQVSSLLAQMVSSLSVQEVGSTIIRVTYGGGSAAAADGDDNPGGAAGQQPQQQQQQAEGHCYLVPVNLMRHTCPEYNLLCALGPVGEDIRKLERTLEELALPSSPGEVLEVDVLSRFEARMIQEINDFMERSWEVVDPASASRLSSVEEELRGKREQLLALRGQVEEERHKQEDLIRNLR